MESAPQTDGVTSRDAMRDSLIDRLDELQRKGQLAAAIDHWKNLPPDTMAAHLRKVATLLARRGVELYGKDRIEDALAFFLLALRAQENCLPALNNAATCLKELGRLEESSAAYRLILALEPHNATAHSNLLFNRHYQSGITPSALAAAHKEWDEKHGAGLYALPAHYPNDPQPERVLRVGLVSPDLGQHPVGIFLVRYLENTDRTQFTFHCYATRRRTGPLTDRIRNSAAYWHDAENLDDETLAHKIRDEGIDILIDLSGHSADNRLGVFARKPAPVQISWLGYPGDSGLSAMDYVIGDRFVLPETMQPFMHTKILHLPCFVCFDPPTGAPPVNLLPATKPGAITFGCFHNPAKCGKDVIALWADILRRLPEARLLFKYRGFDVPSTRQMFEGQFASHGIDPAQLEFQGESPLPRMFEEMNRVDLALDPFPFSGGLMTCLNLWMGIPALTLPGETFASRQGLDFLSATGITDTFAASIQDYSDKAVALAHDLPRLADLRKRLRPAMESSPLCDGPRVTRALQDLLRKVWRDWCRKAAT